MNYTQKLEQDVEELQAQLTHAHDLLHMYENREKLLERSDMHFPYSVTVVRYKADKEELESREQKLSSILKVINYVTFLTLEKNIVAVHITRYSFFSKIVLHMLAYTPEVVIATFVKLTTVEKDCNHKTFAFYSRYSGDPIIDAASSKHMPILNHDPSTTICTRLIDLHKLLKNRYYRSTAAQSPE
jgi:hypothetical protein